MSDLVHHLRGNATDEQFTRNLSMYMMSFCGLVTVSVAGLWMVAEVVVWPLEASVIEVSVRNVVVRSSSCLAGWLTD